MKVGKERNESRNVRQRLYREGTEGEVVAANRWGHDGWERWMGKQ